VGYHKKRDQHLGKLLQGGNSREKAGPAQDALRIAGGYILAAGEKGRLRLKRTRKAQRGDNVFPRLTMGIPARRSRKPETKKEILHMISGGRERHEGGGDFNVGKRGAKALPLPNRAIQHGQQSRATKPSNELKEESKREVQAQYGRSQDKGF